MTVRTLIPDRVLSSRALAALLLAAALATPGCSLQRVATRSVANSLTSGPDVFGTDNDPELVRDALPFGLKTMESLLQTLPKHEGLLVTLWVTGSLLVQVTVPPAFTETSPGA